jgi:hypothetical protein
MTDTLSRSTTTGPRYDFGPLDRMFPAPERRRNEEPDNVVSVCEALGLTVAQLRHHRENGMSTLTADELAVRAGVNPVDLWPSWYDDAALEPSCLICGEPLSEGKTYCCKAHRDQGRRNRQAASARAKTVARSAA